MWDNKRSSALRRRIDMHSRLTGILPLIKRRLIIMKNPAYTRSLSGLIFVLISIYGCNNTPQDSQLVVAETATRPVTVTGVVSDKNGPLKSGKIIANDSSGRTVATSVWQGTPTYSVEIPEGTRYPIEIVALVSKKKLKVAVISPTTSKHDISPLSTKIADMARSLGGYTVKNITQASLTTTEIPGEDRTVGGFKGDPTKRFGGWH